MSTFEKDISDWDKTFIGRWQAAIKREFGSGGVAAHKLAGAGVNPTTVKSWITKGGRPTIANLCLVARASRDPSAFIVEVCGDEPWARELGVALQRRRLCDAELALNMSSAAADQDAVGVLNALAGPRRRYRFATDAGDLTSAFPCPDTAVRHLCGGAVAETAATAADHIMRTQGWILVEEADTHPLIVRCHALAVSERACETLMDWLGTALPRQGFLLRVFITDWVDMPCATLFQFGAELDRVRDLRDHGRDIAAPRGGPSADHRKGNGATQGAMDFRPHAERVSMAETPDAGLAFQAVWDLTGGIVDNELMHNIRHSSLFEMGGVYGVQDQHFRVGYVGQRLRLPEGMTRERILGHNILEIQASRGFGTMIAAHFGLAAAERQPVVHRVHVASQRSYHRVSFPVFDHGGRRVVAVVGLSDARADDGAE